MWGWPHRAQRTHSRATLLPPPPPQRPPADPAPSGCWMQVKEKKSLLARLETMDMGKPIAEAEWDMDDVAGCFLYYAGAHTQAPSEWQALQRTAGQGLALLPSLAVLVPLHARMRPWHGVAWRVWRLGLPGFAQCAPSLPVAHGPSPSHPPIAPHCSPAAAGLAEQLDGRQGEPVDLGSDEFQCRLRREPLGVVGLISPWNYPSEPSLCYAVLCCAALWLPWC